MKRTIRGKKKVVMPLFGCLFLAAAVCFLQIRGGGMPLLAVLACFLLFQIWAADQEKTLGVLLFFLPWSPLLKLYSGSISFFTIALLLTCAYCLLKNGFVLRVQEVVTAALLAALTLTAKAIHGGGPDNSYLCFLFMLLFFPGVIRKSAGREDFFELCLFFAAGIISAALSAQRVAGYANIAKYIRVDSYLSITRLSGYYGDPNFYSAQISACLSGILILLCRERKRERLLLLAAAAMGLLYCGLLSASKAFIITLACQLLVWIPALMEKRNRGGRYRILLGMLAAGLILLFTPTFQDLIEMIDGRFASASNLSELTTGRTELWLNYLDAFTRSALLTFLGMGYTNVNLDGWASHNTVIQLIYQFGLVGGSLLLYWMGLQLKCVLKKGGCSKADWKSVLLIAVGIGLPWMALDLLFFDEIFLLPVYGAAGAVYASERTGTNP